MPVYLHIWNLIIKKSAVSTKYLGGICQFRLDFSIGFSEINQEDDELFSLGKMNFHQFDIGQLTKNGLTFNQLNQFSEDFTILYRYGDFLWNSNWIKHNRVFAWHIDTEKVLINRVTQISDLNVDEIMELQEKGANPLKTIKTE